MLEGWKTARLGELGRASIGLTYSPSQVTDASGTLVLRSSNIRGTRISLEDNVFVAGEVPASSLVQTGDILICVRNGSRSLIGKSAIISEAEAGFAFGAFMAVFRSDHNDYIFQLTQSDEFKRQVHASLGATINQITNGNLTSFKFLIPPQPERSRIAEILRTWDEAIKKLEALRMVKERRLHVLREKLTYADVHHEPVRLGDVTEEVTARNGTRNLDRDKVMGVTNSRGIVPMREQTIAEDISRYKIVADQSFAYNPMRINVGSIARNQSGEDILVSPDYVAFACNPDGLLPDYLDHLRNTKWWAHYINSGGSGSVRQRTYYGDLAAMKVPLSSVSEQQRIAEALNTAQRDAEATTREMTALQRQKRGLMQKLLTGEWRVSVDEQVEAAQ